MKNLFKTIIPLLVLSSIAITAHAQQGFGTNTPHPSSVVDMEASNKGVLLPRVALKGTADNTAGPITSPATNLLVFNTAATGDVTPGFYFWNGSAWIRLLGIADVTGGWSLTGNAGTTAGTNFVGTTDAQDLVFKTNATNDGTEKMRVTTTGSVGFGTATPNAAAKVDISSTTQGFLPPRLTETQMAAIVNPVEGLVVYNTTQECLAYYSIGGFTCVQIAPFISGRSLTGFYNGWVGGNYTGTDRTVTHVAGEAFSTNTACTSNTISVSGCGGAATVTSASGNTYSLKEINGQCWTAENMRETPSNYYSIDNNAWTTNIVEDHSYWGYYNTDHTNGSAGWGTSEPLPANSMGLEGMLYQWSAAMSGATAERSRGICPSGFHVPSDCEWMYLEHGLGMQVADQVSLGWRGTGTETVGRKLTNDGGWYKNVSGFSALFAGFRTSGNGSFNSRHTEAYWWSSSASDASGDVFGRSVSYNGLLPGVYRVSLYVASAFSVRCLKD